MAALQRDAWTAPAVLEADAPHVSITGLRKDFRITIAGQSKRIPALCGVDFAVRKGEIVAVTGASGCGKTTLLRIIMGLETATAGEVRVSGKRVRGCGYDRGLVFQHAELLPWRTALANIEFGLMTKGIRQPLRRRTAERFLAMVGLQNARDRKPHQLSGGMKQRVGIARALAIEPEVLLMDEPFGALDAQTRESLQAELLDIQAATGKTIIIVTHDLDEAVLLADRVVVMERGAVKDIIEIGLPRPRGPLAEMRARPEFGRARVHLWELLRHLPETKQEVGLR
ncbi:ABC transporter ATP-binding protein [Paracoccus suum]|uniref:ABC transporter ATP-binding protein n=2 Tax=Paracoccus suum TaxID=2259340 RepID=A0A344PPI5_9RHOB|nr:ABC transporter ATP-binding protein [Paracoccus suum]